MRILRSCRAAVLAAVLGAGHAARAETPPNIVFVLADDLALSDLDALPGLVDLLAPRGVTFDQAFVNLALCCPSRATTLRGQYAHNTTLFTNRPPDGGYGAFHQLGLDRDTVGLWLQAAGYRTGFYGKYLNGYPSRDNPTERPPGWDDWVVPAKGNAYGSYDYTLNDNGTLVEHGHAPQDHITDVLAQQVTDFVRQTATQGRPFFVEVSVYAPHFPADAPPRHASAFEGVVAPRTASFDEVDVADKVGFVRVPDRLGPEDLATLDQIHRKRLQSMLGVQDLVATLLQTLDELGLRDNTYVVFTSDNGFHLGQHRMRQGKNSHFDEDVHVPLIVTGPGLPAGAHRSQLVVNTDLAVTFSDMAGAKAPSFCDGRSWLEVAQGATPPWRQGVLLEHGHALDPSGTRTAAGGKGARASNKTDPRLLEPADGPAAPAGHPPPPGVAEPDGGLVRPFVGVRTQELTYVRFEHGQRELYDLRVDPAQLQNLAAQADPLLLASLDRWVEAMRTCAGEACRSAEEASPGQLLEP